MEGRSDSGPFGKRPFQQILLAAMLALSGACGGPETQTEGQAPQPNSDIQLVSFDHTGASRAHIAFDQPDIGPATFQSATEEVRTLQAVDGGYNLTFFDDGQDGDGIIDEDSYILAFRDEDGIPVRIELIRQSAGELQEAFSFERPTGYTILGANTLSFANEDKHLIREVSSGYGHKIDLVEGKKPHFALPELQLAAQIVATLYAKPMAFGPSDGGPKASLDEMLGALRAGQDRVQCEGFRDLFLHAAHHHGLNIRLIGLVSYAPPLGDLVSYSHAIAEVETRQGWVAIDPWNNMTFKIDGEFGSIDEVRKAFRTAPDRVQFVPLNKRLQRVDVANDGQYQNAVLVRPEKDFYRRYFGAIEFIEVKFN